MNIKIIHFILFNINWRLVIKEESKDYKKIAVSLEKRSEDSLGESCWFAIDDDKLVVAMLAQAYIECATTPSFIISDPVGVHNAIRDGRKLY